MEARRAGWVAMATAALLAVVGCGGDQDSDERTQPAVEAELVGAEEFAERMADPDAVVVNVHVPYEGEIAGTDLFVPFDRIAASDELPSQTDRPVLLYCRTGNMSATASDELIAAGYTNVTDLEGGMVAWESAGRPIETVPGRRTPQPAG